LRVCRNFPVITTMNQGHSNFRTLADFRMRIIPEFLPQKEARRPLSKDFSARILTF